MGLSNRYENGPSVVVCNQPPNTNMMERQPTDYDILCGKDKRCQAHAGSRRFRAMIQSYQSRYQQATSKQLRMAITKEIYVRCYRSNCRFLKMNEMTKQWEEISPLAARDKISHALRGNYGSRAKNNDKRKQNHPHHHRRTDSESSFESVYSDATTDSSCFFDGDVSLPGDYAGFPSMMPPTEIHGSGQEESLGPARVDSYIDSFGSTAEEQSHILDDANREDKRELKANEADTLEPLPIDVTVDLSFLLRDAHLKLHEDKKEGDRFDSSNNGFRYGSPQLYEEKKDDDDHFESASDCRDRRPHYWKEKEDAGDHYERANNYQDRRPHDWSEAEDGDHFESHGHFQGRRLHSWNSEQHNDHCERTSGHFRDRRPHYWKESEGNSDHYHYQSSRDFQYRRPPYWKEKEGYDHYESSGDFRNRRPHHWNEKEGRDHYESSCDFRYRRPHYWKDTDDGGHYESATEFRNRGAHS